MITWYAKDIIDAAMKEADLENSAYITAEENRMAFQNAYIQLYELAINIGDRTFLEDAEISRGVNSLPEDFYQLNSVIYKGRTISRKSANSSDDAIWYDLRKDKIILNGVPSADIEYYPVPETLWDDDSTPSVNKELSMPSNLYFPIMIHKLAKYYKVRQGGDPSGIMLLEEEAEGILHDTLSRDISDYVQIKEVI